MDGVLARGSNPLDPAVQAIKLLTDREGNLKVPVAFVTNACNRSNDKANQIQQWFNIPVSYYDANFDLTHDSRINLYFKAHMQLKKK